jgi:hypothetical protein
MAIQMKSFSLVLACLVAATPATAASSLPRFKLKPGMTQAQAIRQLDRKINRGPGFSNADCWLWQGNARIGWRHSSCVGTLTYAGRAYRFKATTTPISCSREKQVVAIPGLKTQTSILPWKHETFVCGHS